MSKFLSACKFIVIIAAIFFVANVADVASRQEWSSEISLITNWGRLMQFVVFCIIAINGYRLSIKVERQDEEIKRLRTELYETKDLRANYTINHSERIANIESKIGIR